jgi:mannose-P-dolichol utilization defect protein 1
METLRSVLTPILIKEECFDKFLVDYDFFNADCLKYSLSKGLGLGIIAGSVLVKVPQILKILRGQSAVGITFISVVLELFAITSNLAYSYQNGYPFSAWGEASFLAVQTAAVAALVLFYNFTSALLALSFLIGYSAVVYGLTSELTPIDVLWSMQAANVPLIIVSKMIQAVANYRNQSTGQLSAVTIFLLFFGAVARIFTSIQETGDMIVVYTYCAATFANGLIAFQVLWYWNSKITGKGKKKGGQGQTGGKQQQTAGNKAKNSPTKGANKASKGKKH